MRVVLRLPASEGDPDVAWGPEGAASLVGQSFAALLPGGVQQAEVVGAQVDPADARYVLATVEVDDDPAGLGGLVGSGRHPDAPWPWDSTKTAPPDGTGVVPSMENPEQEEHP